MAEQDWTLVEYRPGRFVKVSPEGEVLGRATEAEARAWFARRGWPLASLRERRTGEPPAPAGQKPAEWQPPAAAVEVASGEEPARASVQAERRAVPPGAEAEAESPVPPHPVVEEGQTASVYAGPEEPAPEVAGPEEQGQTVSGSEIPQAVVLSTDTDRAAAAPTAPEAAEPPGAGDVLLEQPPEPEGLTEKPAAEVEQRWLWLDPRGDPRLSMETLDIKAFLRQASSSFRAKDWAGGREPGQLAVHPDSVTTSLEAAAGELSLEIVADPRVMPGTFMLGLAQPGEEG